MNCKIETLPSYRVAYFRRVGPYGSANHEVMEKLKTWAKEKKLLDSATILAIPQDNPETTPLDNCRFDACIVVSEDFQLDDTILENELLGGRYLVYKVEHTAEEIQKAYTEIFSSIQSSGYQLDNKPIMERYVGDMISNPYCEICVPLKQ